MMVSATARALEHDPDVECNWPTSSSRRGDPRAATFRDRDIDGSLTSPARWEGSTVVLRVPCAGARAQVRRRPGPRVRLPGRRRRRGRLLRGVRRQAPRASPLRSPAWRSTPRSSAGTGAASGSPCAASRGGLGGQEFPAGNEDTEGWDAMRWCAFRTAREPPVGAIGQAAASCCSSRAPRLAGFLSRSLPVGPGTAGDRLRPWAWLCAVPAAPWRGDHLRVREGRVLYRTARRLALRMGRSRRYGAAETKRGHEYLARRCSAQAGACGSSPGAEGRHPASVRPSYTRLGA